MSSNYQWSSTPSSDTDDRLWASTKETIRRMGYRFDRVDRQAGVITTMPEISQQLFEFWRHDVDTSKDLWESAINPIRRLLAINMQSNQDEPGQMKLEVTVNKQRISSLDRQFNSTGAAYQYFGTELPATTGEPFVAATDEHWIDLGRDPAMEDYLLRQILKRAEVVPESR